MKEEQEKDWNEIWLETFKANYEGRTAESKEVADFIKNTYNGASYIPWATMERLTYMQDPNAKFDVISNEKGGLVWTDSFENYNKVVGKDGVTNESQALVVSHFVIVYCRFMGKVFTEQYPIQDQDYSALKIYNQNAVNKAIKRAMAKVASRATGIGLRLYEAKDLQFDDTVEEEKKPEVKKSTKKKTEKVELTDEQKAQNIVDGGETEAFLNGERTFEPQEVKVDENTEKNTEKNTEPVAKEFSKEIVELKDLIKNTDREKMNKVLQALNPAILKQHGFVLSPDYEDVDLCEKLSVFKDVSVFTKAITNMLG